MNKMDKNMQVRENNRALDLIYKEGVFLFYGSCPMALVLIFFSLIRMLLPTKQLFS